MIYADVIVDIAQGNLDRVFQYRIPASLEGKLEEGSPVMIPFGKGNRLIKGYVTGFSDTTDYNPEAIKEIRSLVVGGMSIEQRLLSLAVWMKKKYGCTLIQAMKTVMPVKKKIRTRKDRFLVRTMTVEELHGLLSVCRKKNQKARIRLLEALVQDEAIPYDVILNKLNIGKSTLDSILESGAARLEEKRKRPDNRNQGETAPFVSLNGQQRQIAEEFIRNFDSGNPGISLIHGVTGSGKTEVYMEMIAHVVSQGKQAIMLIPEISLTYQTVMRFYRRFGDQAAFIHSRLSQGERYERFEQARNGEISMMIGPRSALFTPFERLGLIVIDEEHEGAYKSETVPRYHSIDVARRLAKDAGAGLVLGSATPSVDSYTHALKGEYRLYRLSQRAQKGSALPRVSVVDLRKELEQGNRSIFSSELYQAVCDRLEKKEQVMLFLNRRGYASFVSCRSCGRPVNCPHCDVSLKAHRDGRLVCHYCGYSIPIPKLCPSCGSPYIAGFGTGTQKVETMAAQVFPQARILRMDQDTTSGKEGHQKILAAFMAGEADILIGTQMIVKGHDFPNVTLVAALAADLSLYAGDFKSTERTFQLLTQAAGRAGRGEKAGQMIIQTYTPEHYSIRAAARQDYQMFYEEEMTYRRMMEYPPCREMAVMTLSSKDERKAAAAAKEIAGRLSGSAAPETLQVIGPADAAIPRINDIYYKMIYMKSADVRLIFSAIRQVRRFYEWTDWKKSVMIQFDYM